MRKPLIVLAVAATALIALAACGGTSGNDHGDMNGMSDMPGMTHSAAPGGASASKPGSGHNGADATFAQSMIPHHQQAVDMATLATGRAANPKVTQLAQRIAGAQQPEITTMTGWLKTWGMPTPQAHMSDMPGMDHSGSGMMSDQEMRQLTAASGAAFDRLFLQMMIRHHQGAVTMATTEQATGQNAEAIALAKQIVTTQNAEIAEMQLLAGQQ